MLCRTPLRKRHAADSTAYRDHTDSRVHRRLKG